MTFDECIYLIENCNSCKKSLYKYIMESSLGKLEKDETPKKIEEVINILKKIKNNEVKHSFNLNKDGYITVNDWYICSAFKNYIGYINDKDGAGHSEYDFNKSFNDNLLHIQEYIMSFTKMDKTKVSKEYSDKVEKTLDKTTKDNSTTDDSLKKEINILFNKIYKNREELDKGCKELTNKISKDRIGEHGGIKLNKDIEFGYSIKYENKLFAAMADVDAIGRTLNIKPHDYRPSLYGWIKGNPISIPYNFNISLCDNVSKLVIAYSQTKK